MCLKHFRILSSVDAVNERLGIYLTYHDINWVYSFQQNHEVVYYLKTRVHTVRLISCLTETNKGMGKDFLIVLGEWHDGLHCLTTDGIPGEMV